MSTLAEIIAARKAKGQSKEEPKSAGIKAEEKELAKVDTKAIKEHAADHAAAINMLADPVKEEPAIAPAPKPMSFAEKMALKRKEQEAAKVTTITAPAKDAVLSQEKDSSPKEQAPVTTAPAQDALSSSAAPVTTPVSEGITTGEEVSVETRQAYADIKEKIDMLNDMSDTNLEGAMKELKAALMKNPAAVSLMEDSDIGQMVIALRRYTGQAIVEAQKDKRNGRKTKDKPVDLSDPAAIAAVFDEL